MIAQGAKCNLVDYGAFVLLDLSEDSFVLGIDLPIGISLYTFASLSGERAAAESGEVHQLSAAKFGRCNRCLFFCAPEARRLQIAGTLAARARCFVEEWATKRVNAAREIPI